MEKIISFLLGCNKLPLKPVQPFKHEKCQGCILNGCYPWNDLPLTKCVTVGGAAFIPNEETCKKEVTIKFVLNYFQNIMEQAKEFERLRLKAMKGEVKSNQSQLWPLSETTPPKIIVNVKEGLIQEIDKSGVNVIDEVHDYDVEDTTPEELKKLPKDSDKEPYKSQEW
jgi:hypothetical protein